MPTYQQRRDASPPEKSLEQVWHGYLKNGYFDSDGNPNPEYVSRSRVEPLVKAMTEAKPSLNNSQLRRFFQHCRAIEAKLKSGTSTWGAEEANFRKLDIAAADAFRGGKPNKKIPKLFHEFIRTNVAAVKAKHDFLDGFLRHFEALVGFGQQYMEERERS